MPHRAAHRTVPAIALVVAALLLAGPDASRAETTAGERGRPVVATSWVDQLGIYTRAIAAHEPGSADAAAQTIGDWPEDDLDAVRLDLLILQSVCRRGTGRVRLPAGVVARRGSSATSREEAVALLGLAAAPDIERAMNLVLERGAVLHADIAMLVTPFRVDNVGCSSRVTMAVLDGQAVGAGCSNYHWRIGRALLDGLPLNPPAERFVRLWYHATIVFLLEQTNYSDALPQITRARERFPDDSVLQFEHGYYQEALSAPRVQTLVGSARGTLSSEQTHLEAAESSFRRALKLDPGHVEARIRLGAVLTRLGRHRDAVAALQPAVDVPPQDLVLRYLAELFLARAAEGLNDRAAARNHYERAGAAIPSAGAPVLALARLARSSGGRARATELVLRVIGARAGMALPGDPWWEYDLWQTRNSASLLRELRESLGRRDRP